MSISVDDLVASLNANHIGQEAIELAALQVCPTPLPISHHPPTQIFAGPARPVSLFPVHGFVFQ